MSKKKTRRIRIKRHKSPGQGRSRSSRRIRLKRKSFVPQTAKQFSKLSEQTQDRWIRVTNTISKMRSGRLSLRRASQEFDVDPALVIRLGKSALRKRKNGQYVAKPTDTLLRMLAIPTPEGVREVAIRGSEEASRLGKYWATVQRYLQTGDSSALKQLRRKTVTDANGKRVPLILDTAELDRLGSAGVLTFESLYARGGAMKLKRPRDPIATFQREARAIRRVGEDTCCSKCPEERPLALIPGTNPRICANCQREELGKSKLDNHHPAGIANHPLAIPIPVNDHCAVLSPAQYEWPEGTFENPHGSPMLNGACCIRGYYDTNTYLTDELLLWVARLLEALDKWLRERLGPDWWIGTPLEQFARRRS